MESLKLADRPPDRAVAETGQFDQPGNRWPDLGAVASRVQVTHQGDQN